MVGKQKENVQIGSRPETSKNPGACLGNHVTSPVSLGTPASVGFFPGKVSMIV